MHITREFLPRSVPFRIGHTIDGQVAVDIPEIAIGINAMQPDDARFFAAAILKSALLAEGKPVPRHLMVSLP